MPFEYQLKKLIKTSGPIDIATFMKLVVAYYYRNQNSIGKLGDFTTAPEISQLFSEMLFVWVYNSWESLGKPARFNLVELGGGKGTLLHGIMQNLRKFPDIAEALFEIHIVEISEILKESQLQLLTQFNKAIIYHHNFSELAGGLPIILIANEFFDALPIHQYFKDRYNWCENVIDLTPEKEVFYFSKKLSDNGWLEFEFPDAEYNDLIEYSPESIKITQEIAEYIKQNKGAGIIIDYGYNARPKFSTLQAVKAHKYHPILEEVGSADITAHVDFTSLKNVIENRGVECSDIISQRDFLHNHSIEIRVNLLLEKATAKHKAQIVSEYLRLTSLEQMGGLFKVLMFQS